MNYFLVIEIVGSIIYLAQKVFLSFGKRIGWLFGFIGSIAFAIVALHKGSFSYAVLEATSGIIFIFGLFIWRRYEKVERWVTLVMSIITLVGVVLVSVLNLGSPNFFLENTMVALFAVGAIFLVLRNPIGWALYLLGHLVLIVYAYILGTYFILFLQIVSVPFAVIGYKNLRDARSSLSSVLPL